MKACVKVYQSIVKATEKQQFSPQHAGLSAPGGTAARGLAALRMDGLGAFAAAFLRSRAGRGTRPLRTCGSLDFSSPVLIPSFAKHLHFASFAPTGAAS